MSCWNSESPGNKACLLTISAAQRNKQKDKELIRECTLDGSARIMLKY